MGASDFHLVVRGNNDLNEAYSRACEDARYEHGSDGYNGTISTTNGVSLVHREFVPVQVANRMAEYDDDSPYWRGLEKWEACAAIPLLAKDCVTVREVVLNVAIDGAPDYDVRRKAIAAEAERRKRAGEVYLDETRGDSLPPATVRSKVTAQATSGKAVTRYILGGTYISGSPGRSWETGFPSQAAARAWADKALRETQGLGDMKVTIDAITRREDGSPLVIVERKIAKATVPVRVQFGTVRNPKQDGFLFFGWAAE